MDDAVKLSISILKQVMEEKLGAKNIEIVTITPTDGFSPLSPERLSQLLAQH